MDIVKQKQIREWTLLGLVGAMALIANLPRHVLDSIGVEPGLLMALLGMMVVLALFLYLRFFFFLLYALLAFGANLPQQWAESLGINKTPLLAALISMVVLSLINYKTKVVPTGLEPKKRKQNPEATKVLLHAIERGNLRYVKTLLTMDFDIDATDEQGVSPLMCAARHGEFKMVQMLIKRGASPFIVGPSGKASDLALQNNFPAVNEYLKKVEEVQAAEAAKRHPSVPDTNSAVPA
ncbi:MAG: ankyrin repeat domain-containing protein [Sulfuritalea sp.]|nr:ankyrin repeat domain-containing protein [Sulfuritalea sp.]